MNELNQASDSQALRSELIQLLERGFPASVLKRIPSNLPINLVTIQAQAFIELDRYTDARRLLETWYQDSTGESRSELECLWAQVLLRQGLVDQANLTVKHVSETAVNAELQTQALSVLALGYARKHCWLSAETILRKAINIASTHPRLMAAQGRVFLEADKRIDARNIYEKMRTHSSIWAQIHGGWGLSFVAYLLGEFKLAWRTAEEAFSISPEVISPLYVMAHVSIALQDGKSLQSVIQVLEKRSPSAEGIPYLQTEYEHLVNSQNAARKRLPAFPTMVQRRNYCGPSTVELVMRYWRNGWRITNDQIAEKIKTSQSGTPLYRIREFFQLVGFETVRTLVPSTKLKLLIDAGIPVIIQQAFPNSSHVSIVIGYDDLHRTIELQDPMTHAVVNVPEMELAQSRRVYMESAILAFPKKREFERTMAKLDLYDSPAVIWTDEAVILMDDGKFDEAASLMEQAVKRLPGHMLSWILLLHAYFEIWRRDKQEEYYNNEDNASWEQPISSNSAAWKKFLSHLLQAKRSFPEVDFGYMFEGNAALLENDLPRALSAFQKASHLSPEDAVVQASIAECLYELRQFEPALRAAQRSLELDPSLPAGNAWMARILNIQGEPGVEYYARAAVELAPTWWLAQVVLAEVLVIACQLDEASIAVAKALELSPYETDVLLLSGEISLSRNDLAAARQYLEEIYKRSSLLTLHQHYQVQQFFCNLLYGESNFDDAVNHVSRFLVDFPEEPWGLKFLAQAFSRLLSNSEYSLASEEFNQALSFYENAIRSNPSDKSLVMDYVDFLEHAGNDQTTFSAIRSLLEQYPENSELQFLHAEALSKEGQYESAAQGMVQALQQKDGLFNRDILAEAFRIILHERTVKNVEDVVAEVSLMKGETVSLELKRSLGLVLSEQNPNSRADAQRILREVYDANPQDGEVVLQLGNVTENVSAREAFYREAVFANENWELARSTFIRFLLDQNRAREALELCNGWIDRSESIAVLYGRALYELGLYELASEEILRIISKMAAQQPSVDENLFVRLWMAQRKAGLSEKSLITARQGYRFFKRNPQWAMQVAISLGDTGDFDKAHDYIERAISYGLDQSNYLHSLANLAYKEKNFTLALGYLDEWQKHFPDERANGTLGWNHLMRLRIWFEMGEFEYAWMEYSEFDFPVQIWGAAAECALEYHISYLAMLFAERALSKDKKSLPGLLAYAKALEQSGEIKKSLDIFREIRTSNPDEHCPYERLALHEALNGATTSALELADRAVNLGANCKHSWATRGLVYFLSRQPEEALNDLEIAWNRCSEHERQWMPEYWVMLFTLLKNPEVTQYWLEILLDMSEDQIGRQILLKLEPFLQSI